MGFDIKDPDKFIMQQQPMPMGGQEPQQQGQPANAGMGASQAMMEGLVPQQGGAFGATSSLAFDGTSFIPLSKGKYLYSFAAEALLLKTLSV